MWGAPRAPPWGWIVRSPDQKPEDLDAILHGAGGLQGLAVQQAKATRTHLSQQQPMRTCQAIAYAEAAASVPTGLSPI